MKHLTITVDDQVLFSGDVAEITFTASDATVGIQGKMRRATTSSSGGALMQLLASATKQTPAPQQEDESNG
jgi:hypothetical protein